MKRKFLLITAQLLFASAYAQNEQDAIRYSMTGVNGGSRFTAMGGAFGALGADLSCASYNPAGLALFRIGEVCYSGSMRVNNSTGNFYQNSISNTDAFLSFNQFGFAGAWRPAGNVDRRNVFSITSTQVLNLNSTYNYSGYTNSSSIAKDMLNIASQSNDTLRLKSSYEGLGYAAFLLNYDNNRFFSFLDTKRTVLQSRTVVNTGRINDFNISFAHTYMDKLYIGASLGIPTVNYTSTTTHREVDDKDSMRVALTSTNPVTYTTTYADGLPYIFTGLLGFDNLTYTEYFRTNGSGINLKLGVMIRPNDAFRLGAYYHSPTYFNLRDVYYNSLSMVFDGRRNEPYTVTVPESEGGGTFTYELRTPARFGICFGRIFKQKGAIGFDYEFVNYRRALLSSDFPEDFAAANFKIKNAFQPGHNIRLGAEINVKPLMLRLGYHMQGSQYGALFNGNMVRNTVSYGVGFRSQKKVYLDLAMSHIFFNENYSPFRNLGTKVIFDKNNTQFSATLGYKF